jgi:hypothetical protein
MWGEVGSQFARRWRAFFSRLERLHQLDPSLSSHLYLLEILFLGIINQDCDTFVDEWNHHAMTGRAVDQTPAVSDCPIYHYEMFTS